MRKLLAIVLMLLLPLQSLQAASLAVCGPATPGQGAGTATPAHRVHEAHGAHEAHEAHADEAAAHADADGAAGGAHAHHHGGHASAAGDGPQDPAGSAELDGCCHVTASLPVQHLPVAAHAPAQSAVWAGTPLALSHMTSGPFRPPRAALA